ncbi:MAG: anthranilate synthase component I [Verrucomicrobia bacterium]|nr:anthranilate synthase component I [Verrucomicrobiota bacterium]
MYTPGKERFVELAKRGNLVPVYREFMADMETPVSAFAKLDRGAHAFLLESVEGGEKIARYSFLGADPSVVFSARGHEVTLIEDGTSRTFTCEGSPIDELERLLGRYRVVELPELPRFFGGAVGYFAYDVIQYIEEIPQRNPDDLGLPEIAFMITDTICIFDHINHTIKVVSNAHVESDAAAAYDAACRKIDRIVNRLVQPGPHTMVERIEAPEPAEAAAVRSTFEQAEFEAIVEKGKAYIRAGDIFQFVPSQRFEMPTRSAPFDIYRALRSVNPSPYMYFLRFTDFAIVGASPEIMVRCEDGTIEVRPIAGTRPRGATPEEDAALEKELLADPKERAEHIMLVDLGRNDVGRVSKFGTVHVPELMVIERYSHVMHIVSSVQGTLKEGRSAFDVFKASFPAGTVSGAPKIRAMQIVEELEKTRRGPYAGAVGYFSFNGNLDCCITIRTIVVKNGICYVQAGAGIVADSVPEREYEETRNKARGMLKAITLAESY